jgi:hypothetical protein
MSKGMNWDRVRKENQIAKNGIEDAEGRIRIHGEVDKRPGHELRRSPEDAAGRAVSDFIRELARCDVLAKPAPPVPKAVLQRLGLAADQRTAIEFLRRKNQYRAAFVQAAKEHARE